jgi:hypothetical protein
MAKFDFDTAEIGVADIGGKDGNERRKKAK